MMAEASFNTGVEIIKINEYIGKGLFAVRDFKKGEIIFEEKPIISCQFSWNSAYGYLSCDHCFRPLESVEENVRRLIQNNDITLPYNEEKKIEKVKCVSCGVNYCSNECRQLSWEQHHQTLCIQSMNKDPQHCLVMLEEAWKQMHYPPETATIMLLARIVAMVRQSDDKDATRIFFNEFCHKTSNEDEEISHKLLGSEFQGQLEILRRLFERCFPYEEVACWLSPTGFRSLLAMVGTNGQGIGSSPLCEWVQKCEQMCLPAQEKSNLESLIDHIYEELHEKAGIFLNNEGSGLYWLQSSCNHSCTPNASSTFPYNDYRIVVKALHDITAGDQIFLSYLDECTLVRSRHSRRKILQENYLFTCSCSKCQEEINKEDVTSEDEMSDSETELQ